MDELELKLQVPALALPSLRTALSHLGAHRMQLVARYFDTADDELARAGLVLRVRREGRRWVQALKALGDAPLERFEHEVTLLASGTSPPAPDSGRHLVAVEGREFAPLLAALAAAPERLLERYMISVQRWSCRVALEDGTVEAALDIGHIFAGDRRAGIAELELEAIDGRRDKLFALGAQFAGLNGLWLDVRPKSLRGWRLARGAADVPALTQRPAVLRADMDGHEALRAVLSNVLEQVLHNSAELAAGTGSDEHIHQLRVGLRRLRTVLRELGALAARPTGAWDATLAATAHALGVLRDEQAVAEAVEPLLQAAGAPVTRWAVARGSATASEVVKAPDFQRALVELLGLVHGEAPAHAGLPPQAVHALLRERLAHLHAQVRRDGRRFEELGAEGQHRVRKRLKRLRYVADFALALWPNDAGKRLLRRLSKAQDALGRHNDLVVARAKFQADAERDPRALFAVGFLQASQAKSARKARRALERLPMRHWPPAQDT